MLNEVLFYYYQLEEHTIIKPENIKLFILTVVKFAIRQQDAEAKCFPSVVSMTDAFMTSNSKLLIVKSH